MGASLGQWEWEKAISQGSGDPKVMSGGKVPAHTWIETSL